jgi:hypothetical protein
MGGPLSYFPAQNSRLNFFGMSETVRVRCRAVRFLSNGPSAEAPMWHFSDSA